MSENWENVVAELWSEELIMVGASQEEVGLVVYTRAPDGADYEYAETLERFAVKRGDYLDGATWRKVKITAGDYHTAYQCGRYASFLGGIAVLDDPRLPGAPRPVKWTGRVGSESYAAFMSGDEEG